MRKLFAILAVLLAALSLCGCGKDDVANAIDGANSVIGDALDNAPTGSEIVDGIGRFTDAVRAGIDEFNK